MKKNCVYYGFQHKGHVENQTFHVDYKMLTNWRIY